MNFSSRRLRGRRDTRFGFGWDSLEARQLLTINFQIDYTYDTNNFFSTAERRNALQAAANTLGSILNDTLLGITPGGGNTWSLNFDHPGNESTVTLNNQIIPLNTLRVYAGGRNIGGGTIGFGGPGGYNASGDQSFLDLVDGRGQLGALPDDPAAATDLGPWGGSITFDTSTNWYFGLDPSNIGNKTDFYTTALHELTHLIGFGTSFPWQNLLSGTRFTGQKSAARFGTTVPISSDVGHWREGTLDGIYEVSMDPSQTNGERKLISGLDVAGLDDIGWDIKLGTNATTATAINAAVPASGSRSFNSQVIATATDVKLYRLTLTAGQSLTASVSSLSSGLDTLVRMFDGAGNEIASVNAASGVDTLTRTIGVGGTYYLGVSASTNSRYLPADGTNQLMAGATGSFNLTIGLPGGNGGGGTVSGDTVGVFNPANAGFFLRNANSSGTPDITPFVFGNGSFRAIVGDWNGDSIDTVGVFNPANAVFYLRNSNSSGSPDVAPFQFGGANWIPVAGDWDGNGTTTIGVYNPANSVFYLRNTNSSGGVDFAPFQFGAPGFLPVVGDWDGNGTTTIGVYNPANSVFYLRNSNSQGAADAGLFQFGAPNWRPVSGDFDNNGTTTIGVYNPAGAFFLRNSNSSGAADAGQFAYGGANWQPLFGRFVASGTSSARAVTSAATPVVSSLGDNAGLLALETNPVLKLTARKSSRVSESSVSDLARDLLKDLATPTHQSV